MIKLALGEEFSYFHTTWLQSCLFSYKPVFALSLDKWLTSLLSGPCLSNYSGLPNVRDEIPSYESEEMGCLSSPVA